MTWRWAEEVWVGLTVSARGVDRLTSEEGGLAENGEPAEGYIASSDGSKL